VPERRDKDRGETWFASIEKFYEIER
jgi:hypothetical protein